MKETIAKRLAEMRAFFRIRRSEFAKNAAVFAYNRMFLLASSAILDISDTIVSADLTVIFR